MWSCPLQFHLSIFRVVDGDRERESGEKKIDGAKSFSDFQVVIFIDIFQMNNELHFNFN